MVSTAEQDIARRQDRNAPQLPVPPSETEKRTYSDRNLALIIRTSIASFGALLISQGRFVMVSRPLLLLVPFLSFTLIYYLISLCVNIGTRGFDMAGHHRLVSAWRPERQPSLDVFLPICGEPLEVLRNTWTHVSALVQDYPGLAIAYVLDDGDSAEARDLASRLGF